MGIQYEIVTLALRCYEEVKNNKKKKELEESIMIEVEHQSFLELEASIPDIEVS